MPAAIFCAWPSWRGSADSFLYHLLQFVTAPELPPRSWESGTSILDFLDDAGPVYGKACQILMSTLTPEQQELAGRFDLTRLYGDWPPLSQEAIEEILDTEIPTWRDHLELDPNPLGVASMAQAHVATDREGREWVLKVLKPKAVERMEETVAAIESLRHTMGLIPAGPVTRAFLRDLGDLCFSFRREASLTIERETLEKMRERTRGRREKVLVLPATNPEFCSDRVLTMPDGLMVMAKSLVTIEGLAKGIDPEVPLKRIASPVLLRAAKPGIQDILYGEVSQENTPPLRLSGFACPTVTRRI